jgi:predicted Ser/Thr protein kinase
VAITSRGKLLADRYRVLGRLGAGGMAVVVLAEDERLGRKVAVKRLHAASPDDAARRFEREAKLGASLNHPNIVAVYDTVADEEGVLIVMEYVDGHTLRTEVDAGPMEPRRAVEVLSGMAAALDHAHEHGVVHRDVKPANVLIAARDGAVKLTDLGIATAAERTNITGSGVVMGTAAYMAPERLDGNAGDPAADVYSLASVAFEMLSGTKAVTGRTAVEVARRVVSQPPPDLAEVLPGTPRGAAEVLKRGLAKDPEERPASAGELVRTLSAAYAEEAREPRPTAPTRALAGAEPPAPPAARRGRPGWLVPAALLAAVAAVVAIVLAAGSSGGGGEQAQRESAKRPTPTQPAPRAESTPSAGAQQAPPAPSNTQPAPSTGAGSPTAAVSSLYTRAASDDYNGAWALGTDRLHTQFGNVAGFAATFATLQSISFPELRLTSQSGDTATVAFRTDATHTNYTDHCTGTASLVRQSGQWLVDHLNVSGCSHSPGAEAPSEPQGKAKGHHKKGKGPKD